MTRSMRALTAVGVVLMVSVATLADFIEFREGGGGYKIDVTFDDGFFQYSPADDTTNGSLGYNGLQVSSGKANFLVVKDLFDELPPDNGVEDIQIHSATLVLYRYSSGGIGSQMDIYRLTTDWLFDGAGLNEDDVSGLHAEVSSATDWSAGAFSAADYDQAGGVVGTLSDDSYNGANPFDITPLVQQIYATGQNYGIVMFLKPGSSTMVFRASEANLSIRPVLQITYTYGDPPAVYDLTVDNGSGDGQYTEGEYIEVSADSPPSGQLFDEWIGDTAGLDEVDAAEAIFEMPGSDATITATYYVAPVSTLTVNSGSGGGAYPEGAVVSISADAPPTGKVFNFWLGQTQGVDEVDQAATTFTMPGSDATITATYLDSDGPIDWWPPFNDFCRDTFGAEKEPLAYEIPGSDLHFMPDGQWVYESRYSACIGFETNLPAKTYVEYGETDAYGQTVYVETDRYHYVHLAYVQGLAPNSTYHYRLVAEDERGNVLYGPDQTLTTQTPASLAILTGPATLDVPGRTYILVQDIVVDYGAAFLVTADNVTLDLGGHTVVYNEVDDPILDDNFNDNSATGVKARYLSNFKLYNGRIVQGAGNNSGSADCRGFSPVYCQSTSGEVAGITAEWGGRSVSGIRLPWCSSMVVHHNVCIDHGGEIINRQSGPNAIVGASNIFRNLVLRARQGGINPASNGATHSNEIYVDSVATNSFAISYYANTNQYCYMNRIFGTGYLVVGIGTVSDGVSDIEIMDNFIHFQELEPDDRWSEYGSQSGGYCTRVTWGGDNINYHDNVLVTYARDGGMVRGTWQVGGPDIVDVVYRNNIIKAVLQNELSDIQAAVSIGGSGDGDDAPVIYENNKIISNFCNVRFGESYAQGSNSRFYDNTFVKVGPHRSDYKTILCGYYSGDTTGHELYDTVLVGGASFESVAFDGYETAQRDFSVGWTLTVETEPYAVVTIWDKNGLEVFNGQANSQGVVSTRLLEFLQEASGRTYYTRHTVTAEKGADSATVEATVDHTMTIQLPLGSPPLAGDVNGDGFVGQADLDAVLDKWGWTVDPADPADIDNDGFIGQSDLDTVLDNWGQSG